MVSINHQTHANSSSSPTVHPASASRSRVKHILAPTDLGEASPQLAERVDWEERYRENRPKRGLPVTDSSLKVFWGSGDQVQL
jgi:hypothetical protein